MSTFEALAKGFDAIAGRGAGFMRADDAAARVRALLARAEPGEPIGWVWWSFPGKPYRSMHFRDADPVDGDSWEQAIVNGSITRPVPVYAAPDLDVLREALGEYERVTSCDLSEHERAAAGYRLYQSLVGPQKLSTVEKGQEALAPRAEGGNADAMARSAQAADEQRRKWVHDHPPEPTPAAPKRWIPVSEGLPEVVEEVDGSVNCVLAYHKDGWECGSDIQVVNTVWLNKQHPLGSKGITHWMPLPEPPMVAEGSGEKGEGNDKQ